MAVNLDHLNENQLEAVRHVEGPLLILAGAGSGKTRVITYRIATMIEQGIDPGQILAVSFTNKAAGEMAERVAALVGVDLASSIRMSTFHSFGATILREHGAAVGLRPRFTILDRADQISLLREVVSELRLDSARFDKAELLRLVSRTRSPFKRPSEIEQLKLHPLLPYLSRIVRKYEQGLRLRNAVDFDDLLILPVRMFETEAQILAHYQRRFRYIMVDEYQDTNRIQFELLAKLGKHNNVCVVGDDDQAIYAFRGADASHILNFEQHFPGAHTVKLERNYRSTGHILGAAYGVIRHNSARHEKRLWTALGDGEPVELLKVADEEAEASAVIDEMIRSQAEERRTWSDFAILYRTNPQSRTFEEHLRSRDIPYRILGGQSFFDRREVRDALAFIRVVVNPRDDVALRRILNVPPRGIGPGTRERLEQFSVEHSVPLYDTVRRAAEIEQLSTHVKSRIRALVEVIERARVSLERERPSQIVRGLLADIHFERHLKSARERPETVARRLDNIGELLSSLTTFEQRDEGGLEVYAARTALDATAPDRSDDREGDRVTLLTLHASKGLEFQVVFIAGFEDGLLPHVRSMTDEEIGEERRLCYVGMTRARQRLFLIEAQARMRRGELTATKPSPFRDEIPTQHMIGGVARAPEGHDRGMKRNLDALWEAIGGRNHDA